MKIVLSRKALACSVVVALYKLRTSHPLLIIKTIWEACTLSYLPCCYWINTMAKRELGGGNNLFHLQLTVHHQGKSGQELKLKTWNNDACWFVFMVCLSCFLIPPRTICPGMASHTVA